MQNHHSPLTAVLIVSFGLVAAACGGGNGPTLGDPAVLANATLEPVTSTATDLVDRTRTVTDLIDLGASLLDEPAQFTVEIVETRPHDDLAFTQGLEFDGDRLFESRGQYGESAITEIDPLDGETLQSVELAEDFFAEGLTVVDDKLIQITWQEGTAFVYDTADLSLVEEFTYDGEGWGLCYDGSSLYMSDGTSVITRRDPATFEALDTIRVSLDGTEVQRVNELECFGGQIWANVWQTDVILIIDPDTGAVLAQIDASPLTRQVAQTGGGDVLNGIAYDPDSEQMVLTGKYWPSMFLVDFVPCATSCVPDLAP